MAVDFNASQCQSTTVAPEFGLCDKEDSTAAYISEDKEEGWNAIVLNEANIEVTFTAIDNCIDLLRSDGNMESRCDGILTYPGHIPDQVPGCILGWFANSP